MKKGLIVALLMAAMVALLAVAVHANAPIISGLPDVVIGDADAGDNNGTKYLMRYNNVLNLAKPDVVNWNNPTYTTDTFHAYLYADASPAPQTTIQASTRDALKPNLSLSDYTRLVGGLAPASSAAEFTSYVSPSNQFFWLSLIDQGINAVSSNPATNTYTATAASNGVPRASYPGGTPYAKTNAMRLVAAVTSGTTKMVMSSAAFDVWAVSGATDGTSSSVDVVNETNPKQYWVWAPNGDPTFANGATGSSTNGVGFAVATDATKLTYASWLRANSAGSVFVTPFGGALGLTKPVVEMRPTMRIASGAASASPGYRFLALNAAYTNMVAVLYQSGGFGGTEPTPSPANMPGTGADAFGYLMVAPPMNASEMANGQRIALGSWLTGPNAGKDGRDYQFSFDLVNLAASGDTNALLTLEALRVRTFETPGAGTSQVTLNDFNNWVLVAGTTGFEAGTTAKSASSVILGAGTDPTKAYFAAAIPATSAVKTAFPVVTGKTVRLRTTVKSSDVNTAPNVLQYLACMTSADVQRTSIQWWNIVGAVAPIGAKPLTRTPSTATSPGSIPSASAVTVDAYAYMGTAVAAGDYVLPYIQVYTAGVYTGGSGGWPGLTGNITISNETLENVTLP